MQLKKINLAVALTLVLTAFIGIQLYVPSIQYFECKVGEYGTEWEESATGKKNIENLFTSPEYVTVKKYLFGFFYTINNYEIKECEKLDNMLLCAREENNVWLNMLNGKMSQVKKSFGKINEKSGWKCERIERLVK